LTVGFSGADIKNFINLAILNAIKHESKTAYMPDFDYALDRIRMGIQKKGSGVSDKNRLSTAYHEAGHTITSFLTEGANPVHKVTIL
jgi:ATP-dependent metalloprotease